MSQTTSEQTAIQLSYLRDSRIAALALDARPVWLWVVDGTRILWANAAGAATFGVRGPLALAARRFDKGMPIATHVARLAASLTLESPSRLERLRGLGTALGVPCTCACSLIEVETGPALLLVASKRSRPGLPVAERAARLIDGFTAPVALFSSHGQLLHAVPAAQEALTTPTTLAFLGAESLAADAWRSGRASGPSKAGALSIARLGTGQDSALLATIGTLPPALREPDPAFDEAGATFPALRPDEGLHEAPATGPEGASPAATAMAAQEAAPGAVPSATTLAERRHPVRFVWEMDEAGHFDIHSQDFVALLGPATGAVLGRAWQEIRGALALDPQNRIARAVATRDTWSAITLAWPVDGANERIEVELSGLPVFNRERRFSGYRGFGVCRDALDDDQDLAALPDEDTSDGQHDEPLVFPIARSTENVVPFRTATGDRAASLSPVERSAFHELARELASRLQNGSQPGEAAQDDEQQKEATPGVGVTDHVGSDATAAKSDAAAADDIATPANKGEADSNAQPPRDSVTTQYDALANGVLIYTPDRALYANPAFLAWAGYDTLDALDADGGPSAFDVAGLDGRSGVSSGQIITISPVHATDCEPVTAQLTTIAWLVEKPDDGTSGDAAGDDEAHNDATDETAADDVWVSAPWDDRAWNDQDLSDGAWPDDASHEKRRGGEAANDKGRVEETAYLLTLLGGVTGSAPRDTETGQRNAATEPEPEPAKPLPAFALPPDGWQEEDQRDSAPDAAVENTAAALPNQDTSEQDGHNRSDAHQADDAAAQVAAHAAAEHERAAQASAEAATQTHVLRTILDVAADGVLTFDEGGTVLTATARALSLFGVSEQDLVGESFDAMLTFESRAVARAAFDALAQETRHGTGRLRPACEVTGRTRFGATLPMLLTLAPVTDAPRRFCAVFRDISTWKTAEQDLVTARRQAENASAAKSDFLAKMSHEVRTPLNAIIGFSEVMLSERFGPVDNERYRSYLQDIQASGNHVVSMLNDLLDLSKIEQGKLELAFAHIDLNALTQDCVGMMQAQAAKERIILRVSLAHGLPPIIADATSVKQIILNLLSNAIKFTRAGGQIIVATALGDTNSVALRIRDTGVGMSEKDVAIALEPFRQLGTAPRPAQKGSGLGLPLTKALAEANRAGFAIKSAVNVGTLVEIAFNPARAAAE